MQCFVVNLPTIFLQNYSKLMYALCILMLNVNT